MSSTGAPEVNVGRADNYVPVVNGKRRDYKEFRKRCEIYGQKMTRAGRSKETAYNIITMLTGRAWDLVEDLNIESLAEKKGFDLIGAAGRLRKFLCEAAATAGHHPSGECGRLCEDPAEVQDQPQRGAAREDPCLVVHPP